MKYVFAFLVCSLLSFQGLHGQCGTVRSITWDGGGADESWHNPYNWTGDSVPDCNDQVIFDRAFSTKTCRISQTASCGNITMNNRAGRVYLGDGATLNAGHLLVLGAMFICEVKSVALNVSDITLSMNGYCQLTNTNWTGTISLSSGVCTVRAGRQLTTMNLHIQRYGFLSAPEGVKGVITIFGNLTVNAVSSFAHNGGVIRFAGTAPLSLNLDNRSLTAFIVEFNKSGALAAQPGSAVSLSKDTILALRRLTMNEVTFKDQGTSVWGPEDALLVRDTLEIGNGMGDNTGTYAFHSGTGTQAPLTLAFTGTGNSVFLQKQSGGLVGRHRLIVHKATRNSEVRLRGNPLIGTPAGTVYERVRIESGQLVFPDFVKGVLRVQTGTTDKATVGLYIAEQGGLRAPDGDTLDFSGTWDVRDSLGWQMQRGTLRILASGVCFSNGNTLRFHHLDMASRTSSLNLTDGNAHIAGNLTLSSVSTSSSNGTVRGGALFLEGNYTSLRASGSNPTGSPLYFVGNKQQQVRNPLPGELARGIVLQKTGGFVLLMDSASPLARLEFKTGILKSAKLLRCSSGQVFGGNDSSFLEGRLLLLNSGSDNLNILFPIGKDGYYRPLRITHPATIGSSRTWVAEFYNSNPTLSPRGLCRKSPLDSVSGSGYWFINNNYESSSTRYLVRAADVPFATGLARLARWDSLQKCWENKSSAGVSGDWLSSAGTLGTARTSGYHYLTVGKVSASSPPEDNDHEISAVQEEFPDQAWKVFPNPMGNRIQVRCPGATAAVRLDFTDLSGRRIYGCMVSNGDPVDLSFLPPGMYLYALSEGARRIVANCVKL